MLGESFSFLRRKQMSECFNGAGFEMKSIPTPCPCTLEDYMCDFCFELHSGICGKVTDCQSNAVCENGFLNVSKGFEFLLFVKM